MHGSALAGPSRARVYVYAHVCVKDYTACYLLGQPKAAGARGERATPLQAWGQSLTLGVPTPGLQLRPQGAQYGTHGLQGASAVGDPILLLGGQLGKGEIIALGNEYRVVAESALSSGCL